MTDRYVVDFTVDSRMPCWWSNYINKNNFKAREETMRSLSKNNIFLDVPSFADRRLSFQDEADFLVFKLLWS